MRAISCRCLVEVLFVFRIHPFLLSRRGSPPSDSINRRDHPESKRRAVLGGERAKIE
jgi:hypothetical protein